MLRRRYVRSSIGTFAMLGPTLIARYFTEEKPEQDGPWPLSVIKRIVDESIADKNRPYFEETLEEMSIPLVHYHAASFIDAHENLDGILVPKDTATALWEASKGGEERFMTVVIEGEECVLLCLFHGNDRAQPTDGPHTIWGSVIPRVLINETA